MKAIRKCFLLFAAAILLLCRFMPDFAGIWKKAVILPWIQSASSLSSRIPVPVLEALVLMLAGALLPPAFLFLCGVKTLWLRLLRRWFRALWRTMSFLLAVYLFAWMPAYWCEEPLTAIASTDGIEQLCRTLIGELNASSLIFPDADASLRIAVEVASTYGNAPLSANSIKFARYPEWMDFFDLAGFYSPWTGEALVNPDLAPAAIPFTACHELMHRLGTADEGRANIAAWNACLQSGGAAADSARLWALRYAMSALRDADETAWRDCRQSMGARLTGVFSSMSGFADPIPPRSELTSGLLTFTGLSPSIDNYDALVGWLAAGRAE